MKALFEALSKASEAREAWQAHRAEPKPENPDWESRDKALYAEVVKAEREYREAEAAAREGPEPEVRQLERRIEARQYLAAAIADRAVSGAEAEFNKEAGLPDNLMPWEALEPRTWVEPRTEDRTDDVTPITDEVAGQPQMETLRRVFEMGEVGFLNIRSPMVAYGEPNFPVMTGGTSGSTYAPGGEVEADAATFVRETVEPKRLSARYLMRMEDMARFPGLEDILRSDLRMVMTQLRDKQVLTGNPAVSVNDISGVLTNLADPVKTDPTMAAVIDYEKMWDATYEGIDGKYASGPHQMGWLFGIATYKKLASVRFGAAPVNNEVVLEAIRRNAVSYRASAFIPAAATVDTIDNVQFAVRRASMYASDAVAPVWQGVTMIRDPYSGAAKAELAITAHALHGFKFLRKDAWSKEGIRLS